MAGLWTSHQVKFKVIRAEFKLKCTATPFTATYLRPQDQRTDLFYSLRHALYLTQPGNGQGSYLEARTTPTAALLGMVPQGRLPGADPRYPSICSPSLQMAGW